MECISLGFSILAILSSIFIYVNHDRRLKKQEELINGYELEKRRSEKEELKKAQVKGNIISYEKGLRKLVTFNAGKAIAYNIRIEMLSDTNGIIYSDIDPYEMLNPQDNFENNMHLAYGHPPTLKIKYIWDDEFMKNREFVQVLDLK